MTAEPLQELPATGNARPLFWVVAAGLLFVLWKVAILVTASPVVAGLCVGITVLAAVEKVSKRWPRAARICAAVAAAGAVAHATGLVLHLKLVLNS